MENQNLQVHANQKDIALDSTLRPLVWDDYIGQHKTKERLQIFIEASKKRQDVLDHILLYGPPGLGKTTLSYIIARQLNVNIKTTSGPAIEKGSDLVSILTNLSQNDILFIDEIHRLNKHIEEILYPALEQRVLDIILGKGPSARSIQIDLPPFTLIGATTKIGLISAPLRSRFGITTRLEFYEVADIEKIIMRSCSLLNVNADKDAVSFVAHRSRSTPRIANRLIKRIRDYADVKHNSKVSLQATQEAMDVLEIDDLGLEPTDRVFLETIIQKFNGGPVGVKTIADSIAEEKETIESVYEPYLMRLGFIDRTPRGRMATPSAYEHLGITK